MYDGADEEEALFALLSLHYGVALAIPGCPHFLASVDSTTGLKLMPRDVGITQFAWRRSALIRAYQMPEEAAPAPHVPKLWKNLRLAAWGVREHVLDMHDLPRNIAEQVERLLRAQAREDQEALPASGPAEFRFLDVRS